MNKSTLKIIAATLALLTFGPACIAAEMKTVRGIVKTGSLDSAIGDYTFISSSLAGRRILDRCKMDDLCEVEAAVDRGTIVSVTKATKIAAEASHAQTTCENLWIRRNSIYKDAGYCFKTSRAISMFGNAGCKYDDNRDLPLSARDREAIIDIARLEIAGRCGGAASVASANTVAYEEIVFRLEFSPAAFKKLSDNNEMIHLAATYYGNSKKSDSDSWPSDITLSRVEIDVAASAASVLATLPAGTFDRRMVDRIYDREPQVNVQIYSSRRVFINNIVNCDMQQYSVADLARTIHPVKCTLIGER